MTAASLGDFANRDLTQLNVSQFLSEAAAEGGDRPFLISETDSVSYVQFDRMVDVAARAWQDIGVRKGDRVAFMLENRPEFLQAWLGLTRAGGILVALNARWQLGEIAAFLDLTEPRYLLASERFLELVRQTPCSRTGLEILSIGGSGPKDLSMILSTTTAKPAHVPLDSNDEISFISTSGTTGRPKAVMQTHGNYVFTGEGYATWMALRPGERLYLCLPLFHINSQAYTVMGAIAARATIVMRERFSASRFWPDMNEFGIDVFNYIGSMLAVLLKRDSSSEERSHKVRLAYGGPALPGPQRQAAEERFGLKIVSGIGMSENTFGLIESFSGERRDGSLGKVRQHPDPRILNEAKVVDDEGHEVDSGQTGELIFRNPVMMKGYFRDPAQTAETIREGWLHTGDLVSRDEDGFFYFVDRKQDIIRVRGENVASAEVEQVLIGHDGVADAGVVGVPSELTDEDVAALVVALPGQRPTPDELVEWCRSRLAGFKVPRYIWFVDSLPKTETQRTEKQKLRVLAAEFLSGSDARS